MNNNKQYYYRGTPVKILGKHRSVANHYMVNGHFKPYTYPINICVHKDDLVTNVGLNNHHQH